MKIIVYQQRVDCLDVGFHVLYLTEIIVLQQYAYSRILGVCMDYKKTGRLIHKKRKEQGLSLVQLSKLLLCTPQAISLWEHGERYPDFGAQIMIHKVLGLNPVELITGLEIFDDDLKKGIAGHIA